MRRRQNWIFLAYFLFQHFMISISLPNYSYTAQKMKFSIKDFFSKCDQTRRKLGIWLHLLKKSLTENLIFCAVLIT